jgi:hypothetical protein
MPAKSKAQQRFMGMVHKCQKTGECSSEDVEKTAKSMKKNDAEDFASTKHKGLPEKKKKIRESLVCESLDSFLQGNQNFYLKYLLMHLLIEKGLTYEEADFSVLNINDFSWREWQSEYEKNPQILQSVANDIIKFNFNK